MTGKLSIILVLLIILVPMIAGCQASTGPSGITVSITPVKGNPAPDFQLPNLDGQIISLSSLRGSPVLLNFWATWCGPCREEMPYLQQIHEEWSDRGLVVLAINLTYSSFSESPATVKSYLQSNNLSLPVLLDTRQEVGRQYNIRNIPTTLFIDKNGIIQGVKIGAFQNAEQIEQYLGEIIP